MKYSTALVVGRFQPFHKGHWHLLQKALEVADTIVIAVGSSNIQNEDNPLSFDQRVEMLKIVLEQEKIADRVGKIVPSPDFPDDETWTRTLLHNAGEFQVALGNNDWTNSVLAAAGYNVMPISFLDRETYQGQYIRTLFRQHGNWQERVPAYLHQFLEKALH